MAVCLPGAVGIDAFMLIIDPYKSFSGMGTGRGIFSKSPLPAHSHEYDLPSILLVIARKR